jgi:hypothetical protein
MLAVLRIVFGLLLVAGLLCFVAYLITGHPGWRRRGLAIVKWTLIAALGFFAVLVLERLGRMV